MALTEYNRKRDFTRTSEPRPRVTKSYGQPIFVVQEHHASRLHYDFRLEADGVLKSWAVPKQPTNDPATKRLAVHVEDHPLEYAKFSGVIPKGEYGAGKVRIWDKGTYQNLLADKPQPRTVSSAIKEGHVEVLLRGKRLRGKFALVRMNGNDKRDNWLLIKMKDSPTDRALRARRPSIAIRRRSAERRPSPVSEDKPQVKAGLAKSVKLTNQDKIIFPELGVTKGEVLSFYERIADRLLPHLQDRPMTMERLPDGLRKGAPHFWQKNTPSYYPAWIPRIKVKSEDGDTVEYALVNDLKSLLYLVNQGTLTFHPWLSRIKTLDNPDFVLFDLDPGKASFSDVVVVAKKLHRILKGESLDSFMKTSGKSGLHILVPWQQGGSYIQARGWALGIAERLVEALPDSTTVERQKSRRKGKVYIDVLQNVRGHHVVPPYVLRADPEATVSIPLRWDELSPKLDPKKFDIKTIFRRLARQAADPFTPLVEFFQDRTV